MKKTISIILILFVTIGFLSAQNNQDEIASIEKKITKSDKDIQNEKKKAKPQTWEKRGKLFVDAYTVNTKLLAPGLNSLMLRTLGKSDSDPSPFFGEPKEKRIEDQYEVWSYDKIDIYMVQAEKDLVVEKWVETKIPFPGALLKSYEAYMEAVNLDTGKKLVSKKSFLVKLKELRDLLMNEAVTKFYDKNYDEALTYIEKCIKLADYKAKDDTVNLASYAYYAGIFAYNAQKRDDAKKYFNIAIEKEYEIGTSYQYLSQVMYEQKDSANAVKLLEKGLNKYPNEEKIIYCLIDYYTPKGEYEKAFEYIDKALSLAPDNSVLYIVKGNAYTKVFEEFENKYYRLAISADSLDKASFKNRSNKSVYDKIIKERDDILNNQLPPVKKQMNDYKQKTVSAYNSGISKDSKNADYYYTLAYFYYKTGINNQTYASSIRKLKDIVTELEKASTDNMNKAKEKAEKAYQINPKDTYTLDLLSKIYYRLQMYDKSSEMKKKMNELK